VVELGMELFSVFCLRSVMIDLSKAIEILISYHNVSMSRLDKITV